MPAVQLYMAALEPPEKVSSEIRMLQTEFVEKFGSAAALKPPVHITFSPPEQLSETELETYRRQIKNISQKYGPMNIEIDGFDFFEKNRVLFLRVKENAQLLEMQNSFAFGKTNPDRRTYHPHITIGYRKILPEIFENIIREYQDRDFHKIFQVNSIQLWRYENKSWNTIQRFPFSEK